MAIVKDRFGQRDTNDVRFGPHNADPTVEQIIAHAAIILKKARMAMHYRNGREAKNGDKVVQFAMDESGKITAFGVLHSAVPGNDYCNGMIAPIQHPVTTACICDCLHVDDLAELLTTKGWNKRPANK